MTNHNVGRSEKSFSTTSIPKRGCGTFAQLLRFRNMEWLVAAGLWLLTICHSQRTIAPFRHQLPRQLIPRPAHGHQPTWFTRIGLDFLAQMADVDIDRALGLDFAGVTPNLLDQLAACKRLFRMA